MITSFRKWLEENEAQHKIFCDLDGVLVDLKGTVSRLTKQNVDIDSQSNFMRAMVLLRRKGVFGNSEQFWADLPWTADGQELWNDTDRSVERGQWCWSWQGCMV